MKIVKEITVAFTGNRSLTTTDGRPDANLENVIRTELLYIFEELYEEGKNCYLNGGAVGFDMIAAEEVLKFRETHPDVTLVMAIPFMGQELMYSPSDKLRYKRILEQANDKVVIWSGSYSSLAYHKRNDFLVNNCSEIIAYSNGLGRGTKSTVDKAKRAGVDALNLYDELDDYFRIENRTKTFLQNFPNISSFMYGREGVIFKGDNQPFPVNFNQIVKIEQNHDSLCFFLSDGLKISASLTLDECFVSTPKSDR